MAGCCELGGDWGAVWVDGEGSLAVDPGHGPWVVGMDSSQPLKEFPWKGIRKWAEMRAPGGPSLKMGVRQPLVSAGESAQGGKSW